MLQTGPIHITAEGLEKIKHDLDYLIAVRRVEIADSLRETSTGGDNLDNTEYQVALYEQLLLESRIAYLQRTLSNVTLIEPGDNNGSIKIGSSVTIEDEVKQLESYLIVGPIDADPFSSRISYECPLGKALLHRKVGDSVWVQTPDGETRYRVVSVA